MAAKKTTKKAPAKKAKAAPKKATPKKATPKKATPKKAAPQKITTARPARAKGAEQAATAGEKRSPMFGRAMKLVASGASGFKIIGSTRTLDPAEEVLVFEALAARPSPPAEAPDLLAKAYARAGRHADAVRLGKEGALPGTLQEVGEAALDGGAFADAAAAFGAIEAPSAAVLVGLAIARGRLGEDARDALARAEKANVAKKAIDWKSASSCYERVGVAIAKAMIQSVSGDAAAAKATLAEARALFAANVAQKGVRQECDDQLAAPSDPQWWGAPIARHAGL